MADEKKKRNKLENVRWFKINIENRAALQAIDDATLGQALKLALAYMDKRRAAEENKPTDLPDISDAGKKIALSIFKAEIDHSFDEYARSEAAGKAGADKRWADAEAKIRKEYEEKYKDYVPYK